MLQERNRPVKRRTSLTNSMKGLLRLRGITGVNPRRKDFTEKLGGLKTGYGGTLVEAARRELARLRAHLDLVQDQITAVEAERDRMILLGRKIAGASAGLDDSVDRTTARIALLTALRGSGQMMRRC